MAPLYYTFSAILALLTIAGSAFGTPSTPWALWIPILSGVFALYGVGDQLSRIHDKLPDEP